MFKRQLIKEIGLFDHVNFPSGYGEVAAGDACFMLSDLYGGEGTVFMPTTIAPTPTLSSSLTVASSALSSNNNSDSGNSNSKSNSNSNSRGRSNIHGESNGTSNNNSQGDQSPPLHPLQSDPLRQVCPQISITAKGINVVVQERYGLFLLDSLRSCVDSRQLKPLLQVL